MANVGVCVRDETCRGTRGRLWIFTFGSSHVITCSGTSGRTHKYHNCHATLLLINKMQAQEINNNNKVPSHVYTLKYLIRADFYGTNILKKLRTFPLWPKEEKAKVPTWMSPSAALSIASYICWVDVHGLGKKRSKAACMEWDLICIQCNANELGNLNWKHKIHSVALLKNTMLHNIIQKQAPKPGSRPSHQPTAPTAVTSQPCLFVVSFQHSANKALMDELPWLTRCSCGTCTFL